MGKLASTNGREISKKKFVLFVQEPNQQDNYTSNNGEIATPEAFHLFSFWA
jgi:hypothetical protein